MNVEVMAAALAAIIGSFLGFALKTIQSNYKNRKGNRICVKRISETPQISISKRVRQNLEIKYNDQPVNNLVLNTIQIINESAGKNDIIKPMEISLVVNNPEDVSFIEIETNDPGRRLKIERDINDAFNYKINRDYINPIIAYPKEVIELAIFSNAKLKFSVYGSGQGWYADYQDVGEDENKKLVIGKNIGAGVLISIVSVLLATLITYAVASSSR